MSPKELYLVIHETVERKLETMVANGESEREILAGIRTLLALERNYLAEDRTALAQLRTGLTLALIGPPASAVVAYLISIIPIMANVVFDLLNIVFFAVITIVGVWMCLNARTELKQIGRKKKILRAREAELLKNSKVAQDLLGDLLSLEKEKTDWASRLLGKNE
ncbi:MAG: hypothetical protein NWF09_02110 [Candidatus Bathyarchaeota archaeon]|nr:hypothetical protein [Candidatus Bathyarchaeota archaeon]